MTLHALGNAAEKLKSIAVLIATWSPPLPRAMSRAFRDQISFSAAFAAPSYANGDGGVPVLIQLYIADRVQDGEFFFHKLSQVPFLHYHQVTAAAEFL